MGSFQMFSNKALINNNCGQPLDNYSITVLSYNYLCKSVMKKLVWQPKAATSNTDSCELSWYIFVIADGTSRCYNENLQCHLSFSTMTTLSFHWLNGVLHHARETTDAQVPIKCQVISSIHFDEDHSVPYTIMMWYGMESLSALLALCEGDPSVMSGFPPMESQ